MDKTLLMVAMVMTSASASESVFNVSAVHIVALQPRAAHVMRLEQEARSWLGEGVIVVHQATTVTNASAIPIHVRMAMLRGRHSHSEIGSAAALGCLMSHVAIWRTVRDGATIAVFEEDARLDAASNLRTAALALDLQGRDWELLVLESGHVTVSGEWLRTGAHLATCAPSPNICEWHGSRGYLLHYRGAQQLLASALTSHVQTDALFWMLAALEPTRFRMYWTTLNVAHQASWVRGSSVWDRCIKCYVPLSPLFILCWVVLAILGISSAKRYLIIVCYSKNEGPSKV